MSQIGSLQLVIAAMLCGVLASWLIGVAFYIRFLRRTPLLTKTSFETLLRPPAHQAMSQLTAKLDQSPHFVVKLTGRLEGVLTALIDTTGRTPGVNARLTVRIDNYDARIRLRAGLDFSEAIARVQALARLLLLAIWPGWTALVTTVVIVILSMVDHPETWLALQLLHAIYPLAVLLAVQIGFGRSHSALNDAVASVVQDLESQYR